jgi:hypothetical protein
MRTKQYSFNVTLNGCCDHRAMIAGEDLHRYAVENLVQIPPLWPGELRMMEAPWRPQARTGARPDSMKPSAYEADADSSSGRLRLEMTSSTTP